MVDFQTLAQEALTNHWKDVVEKHLGAATAYAWSVSDHCAIAPLLAMPKACHNALVTHCGTGTYTLVLSNLCEKVYSTDPNIHAARFAHIRAQQSNRLNVSTFAGRPDEILKPNSIDLIVTTMPSAETDLEKLTDLLKLDGRICISCANASSIRKSTKGPFYNKRTFLRALQRRALTNIQTYAAYPNHENVHTLIHTQDKRAFGALQQMPFLRHVKTSLFKSITHRLFVHFMAGGYWYYATYAPVQKHN